MSIYWVRVRRDNASTWTAANPILKIGEAGYELDTKRLKIGNGSSSWNTLEYIVADAGAHNQSIATVIGLQAGLDSKSNTGHSHLISDIDSLQSNLNGKANSAHSHYISDVTNLQSSLNNKSSLGHVHAISDITLLQGTLDTKSDQVHTHSLDDLDDVNVSSATVGQALVYNGSNWYAGSLGYIATGTNPNPTGYSYGHRWFNTNSGIEYSLIDDGTTKQWVEMSRVGAVSGTVIDGGIP
jgi:Phage tail repeat like/Major tropism determinant N-terminal domain